YVYSSEPRRIERRFTRSAFERSEPEQPAAERARLRKRPERGAAASAVRVPARRTAVRFAAAVRRLQRSGPALWFAAVAARRLARIAALRSAACAEPEPRRPARPGPGSVQTGPGPLRPGSRPLRAGPARCQPVRAEPVRSERSRL